MLLPGGNVAIATIVTMTVLADSSRVLPGFPLCRIFFCTCSWRFRLTSSKIRFHRRTKNIWHSLTLQQTFKSVSSFCALFEIVRDIQVYACLSLLPFALMRGFVDWAVWTLVPSSHMSQNDLALTSVQSQGVASSSIRRHCDLKWLLGCGVIFTCLVHRSERYLTTPMVRRHWM